MKSLNRGGIAGNIKMHGKRSHLLSCGCCEVKNFKLDERLREADHEINRFLSTDPEKEKQEHLQVLIDTKLIDDDDGLPWSEWFELHLTFEPEIAPEIWKKYFKVRV